MMTRSSIFLLLLLTVSLKTFSQDKDFGIWYGIDAKHKFTSKLDLEVSSFVRTFDNAHKIEQAFIEAGLEYMINKFLSAAGSYRLLSNIEDNSGYYLQHKAFFDLKGQFDIADLRLVSRIRFQTRVKTFHEYVEDKYPDYTARFRLKLTYRTPSFPLNPYIYGELFCPLADNIKTVIGKNRAVAGLEFKIVKNHSAELEYIFQRDYIPDKSDESILSICYSFSF